MLKQYIQRLNDDFQDTYSTELGIAFDLVLYLTWYCILLCIVSNLVLFRVGVVLNLVLYLSLYCIQLGIALT